MEKVRFKTPEEINKEKQNTYKLTRITDINHTYFYLMCETCNCAFFRDQNDEVMYSKSENMFRCPNTITPNPFFFWKEKRICLNNLYGGDEDGFNKYYKII